MAREDFLKYAASYSGIDGGDIDAEYWFMGMEWSDQSDIAGDYDFIHDKWREITKIPKYINIKENKNTWKLENRLDILFHMLLPVSAGGRTIFEEDSNTLKLNLLPLPFLNTDEKRAWEKTKLQELTGFENFEDYKNGVVEARSKLFEKLLEKGEKQKTIFCFGSGYAKQILKVLKISDKLCLEEEELPHRKEKVFYSSDLEKENPRIKRIIISPFPYIQYKPASDFDETDWQTICTLAKE